MKKNLLILSFAILFCTFNSIAATHTIFFGGSVGLAYLPASVEAEIGDEIIFKGNFNLHPLSSVNVPSGADDFASNTGTDDYIYTVLFEGIYNYQCDFHAASGMVGSFIVVNPLNINPITQITATVFPNPSSDFVNINIASPSQNSFANIYSMNGTLVKTVNLEVNGINRISIDDLKSGIYLVQITSNDALNQNTSFIKQ